MGESNFFGVGRRNSGGGSVIVGKIRQLRFLPPISLLLPSSLNLGFVAQPSAFHQTAPWWFSKGGLLASRKFSVWVQERGAGRLAGG